MGATYVDGATLRELMSDLRHPNQWRSRPRFGNPTARWKTEALCFRGNPRFKGTIWAVMSVYQYPRIGPCLPYDLLDRYILCRIVQRYSDKQSSGWSYSDYTEYEHPYYYNCPKKYLRMTEGAYSELMGPRALANRAEWRSRVHAWHQRKKKCTPTRTR